jgi:hypothetical protein
VEVSPRRRWERDGRDEAVISRRDERSWWIMCGREGGGTDDRRPWSLMRVAEREEDVGVDDRDSRVDKLES